MKNAINWFEIPVLDFERAQKFYESVFKIDMHGMPMENPNGKWGFFPFDPKIGGIGGSIVKGPGYKPSQTGALIYLNGGDDLSIPLSRVELAGGKINLPKTDIGENGFMAHFTDTEGNKLGLHSKS